MGNVIEFRPHLTALEFFAGIGLARAGMKAAAIDTIWANDIDKTKRKLYLAQWGDDHLVTDDVFAINPDSVPSADIAWASSPCTDLSLAGKREGLVNGRESSAFFGFVDVLEGMGDRKPRAVILENVTGLASSHDGDDFRTVVKEFNRLGYSVDAFELDARRWLPQSRPRMFVVGLASPIGGGVLESAIRPGRLSWIHSDEALVTHVTPIPDVPTMRTEGLTALAERLSPDDRRWWDEDRYGKFVSSLSSVQHDRFDALVKGDTVVARTAYRRTRSGKPMWEIRNDDVAGCLRTARGGSSKQAIAFLGRGNARVRWMTGLEYAMLQGADDFALDGFRESQVQYAFGDAVAVPAVTWLMKSTVIPALASNGVKSTGDEVLADVV